MKKAYKNILTSNAREFRKNMTKEEKHLWYDFLKKLPVNIFRQKVIGNYIVDFYISNSKIAIELDGSQHYEEQHQEKDKERDAYLMSLGMKVLRYSNYDINHNFDMVCLDIQNNIKSIYNKTRR